MSGKFHLHAVFRRGAVGHLDTSAVECARVMREAGWEVPPQLEALEDETNRNVVAAVAGPRVKSEVVAPAPSGQNDATAPPTIDAAAAAQPATLVERKLPLIKTKSGHLVVDQDEAKRSADASIDKDTKRRRRAARRDRRPATPFAGFHAGHDDIHRRRRIGVAEEESACLGETSGSSVLAGFARRFRRRLCSRERVAPMGQENEVLVVFFGENSFGWVREDQCLDYEEHYATKSRDPARNKARFQAAVKHADDELLIRETRETPIDSRKMATQNTIHKFRSRGGSPMPELKGCTCKSCTNVSADGSDSPRCIRVEAAERGESRPHWRETHHSGENRRW